MKTILFLSLVFGCNLIANAHQTVKSSDIDNLHFGDSIHYDLVDASKISAINLTGSLWDFSNIKYLGQEKEVCFIGDMEGHVKLIGQDEILDFCQSNDYLRLSQIQTPHESVVTNTTDYIGNFIFEDGKLDKYLFDGGYCSFDNNQNPTFHYYEKDHLGSVRMVVNENGTIEQVNHYYPFGGVYGDLSYNSEYQRNKYIGKEFDHMHGLDWYDHGARMYDAAKVVWNKVDPLSEIYFHFDPYLYCENNPIVMFDNTGLLGVRIVDMENKTITVSADYYVETQPYQVYTNVYSQKDVDDFNRLNSELNKLNLKVKSGEPKIRNYHPIHD